MCGVRLLLVDDDAFSRKLMLEILRRPGICVDVAENGAEAVEKVGQTDYAAVLMDCQMPVMDGFEATRKIRENRRFADLPILAMSGDATEDDRKKCIECGMNGHVAKPIDAVQLFTALECWIKLKATAVAEQGGRASANSGEMPNGHGKDAAFDDKPRHARSPLPNPLGETTSHSTRLQETAAKSLVIPQASEGANESLREFYVNVPSLELSKALRHLDGNVNLLRKLIIRFGETQADTVLRIRVAIESGDTETAARTAHTFKGVAGNIGATGMSACAAMVESMLKQGNADGLAEALDEMGQKLKLLLEQIAAAMDGYKPLAATSPGGFTDMETFVGELRELAALLADGDSRARRLADGIVYRLGEIGQGDIADQLKKCISRYDFKGAMDKLKEAAQTLGIAL